MFGFKNNKYDKFKKLEGAMQQDLDKWLSNMYFEVQKCDLADIKVYEEFETKVAEEKPTWGSKKATDDVNKPKLQ
jgi:hypothetical protein